MHQISGPKYGWGTLLKRSYWSSCNKKYRKWYGKGDVAANTSEAIYDKDLELASDDTL